MDCYYCDKIKAVAPDYVSEPASHDLGSEAPRCPKHWRYVCGMCGTANHFMQIAYCQEARKFFCDECALETEEVGNSFWAWKYYFNYRSPWSNDWASSLDRTEFEGTHPLQHDGTRPEAQAAVSQEQYLVRYPPNTVSWRPQRDFTDADVRSNWNTNAVKWNSLYDDDGDRNRRYQSDEPMLALLGNVRSLRILDVGSGNGYLCRKLAKAGAAMTGVELSDGFMEIAMGREKEEALDITYHNASASEMDFLPDARFDKAVSNYVLMDIRDYEAALRHVFRVLKPGGIFIAVISHPCFASGPEGWVTPALDTPRIEERFAWRVDNYFQRGPYLGQWGDLDPVLSFHRPVKDYWRAFADTGFVVTDFDEPSISERGRRELSPWVVERALRIPYSCIFQLTKPKGRPGGSPLPS